MKVWYAGSSEQEALQMQTAIRDLAGISVRAGVPLLLDALTTGAAVRAKLEIHKLVQVTAANPRVCIIVLVLQWKLSDLAK